MNFLISLAGWIVWNIAEMETSRRELDDDGNPNTAFSLKEYAMSHRFIWIGSIFCIPILLWFGYKNLDINPAASLIGLSGEINVWHDLYILASGAAFEAFIFAVKKVKSFFKKKESEL